MKKNRLIFIAMILFLPFVASCRGDKSSSPSVMLVRNMVDQTSYGPQSGNELYKDKKSQRDPVAGTVASGEAYTNTVIFKGQEAGSTEKNPIWVKKIPLPISSQFLANGREHYNTYCSACHGYAGNNDGLVTKAAGGSIAPANIHDADKIKLPVGKIYDAITNGVNNWNMPGFSEQMSVQERWAVVAYVRALQLSQNAPLKFVPKNEMK